MELSYKVEGLRSIRSMPYIELKPVTILVGLNNSGKSTFLRSLPLIKQSINFGPTRVENPISWQGELVDFESFSTSVNQNSKNNEITFHFKISNISLTNIFDESLLLQENYHVIETVFPDISKESNELKDVHYSATIKLFTNNWNDSYTVLKNVTIKISNLDLIFNVKFEENGRSIKYVKINGTDLFNDFDYNGIASNSDSIILSEFILSLFIASISSDGDELPKNLNIRICQNFKLLSVLREMSFQLAHGKSGHKFDFLLNSKSLVKAFNNDKKVGNFHNVKLFDKIYKKLNETDREKLRNYGKMLLFSATISNIHVILVKAITDLSYLGPARVIERSKSYTTEFPVSRLDPKGLDLPEFFVSIGVNDLKKFSKWIKNLYGYGVEVVRNNGRMSVNVTIEDKKFNVTDTGFGVSQILPALAQIWWCKNKRTMDITEMGESINVQQIVAMEQPELHLHPVQQAQLAQAITSVIAKKENPESLNPRFIVETHSEKLVSKFSNLIREKKIKHSDIQVVVFSNDEGDCTHSNVKVCNFNEGGRLVDWPIGFFNSGG